jgi:hypothetical protein
VRRDRFEIGTISNFVLHGDYGHVLARNRSAPTFSPKMRLPDGTTIASLYWIGNTPAEGARYDETFVLTVDLSLTDPLATLALVWGLRMPNLIHIDAGGG